MNRNRSRAIAVIALAAMMLRALLPDGWMPASSAGAETLLTICTMNGPVRVALGEDGQPQKQQPAKHNSGSHEICPFAAAQHFAAPISLASVAIPSVAAPALYGEAAAKISGARDLYSPQSPRGPPSLV
jgi:hypothetical protein